MKLSVPFIPDQPYILFLKKRIQSIESIYFSFHSGPVLDARMRFQHVSLEKLTKGLNQLGPVKKYCLLNTRFIHPEQYHDAGFLDDLIDRLNYLISQSQISGFVFSDAYLLTALAARKNKGIRRLEAVPGINCMIDSFEKMISFFEIIEAADFLLPKKIILDRSLNRDMDGLERISRHSRKSYPDMKIELLANEGCIHYCPYKLAHDSQISFSNIESVKNLTLITNREVGCHSYFFKRPDRFFKSPFIRPEDTDAYAGLADTIKLCGRTIGSRFLKKCIYAYISQSYSGNLLDLMDATNWMSDLYHIDNKSLDPGFLKMITHCTKTCKNCNLCKNLFSIAAREKTFKIRAYKDYQ